MNKTFISLTLVSIIALSSNGAFAEDSKAFSGKLGNVASGAEVQSQKILKALPNPAMDMDGNLEDRLLFEQMMADEETKRLKEESGTIFGHSNKAMEEAKAKAKTEEVVEIVEEKKELTPEELKKQRYEAYLKKREDDKLKAMAAEKKKSFADRINEQRSKDSRSKRSQAKYDAEKKKAERSKAVLDQVIREELGGTSALEPEKKLSWSERRKEQKRRGSLTARQKAKEDLENKRLAKEKEAARKSIQLLKATQGGAYGTTDQAVAAEETRPKTKLELFKEKRRKKIEEMRAKRNK